MPLSNRIAGAAYCFNQNSGVLKRSLEGLSVEEWRKRPNDSSNHVLWIVCHMAWARTLLLKRLGNDWTMPWMPLFARGQKCADTPECPSPEEAMKAWDTSCAELAAALEGASEEMLNTPVTQGPPTADGKMSGMVDFMAYHETYHVGQLAYLRAWLGKPGAMG
jgi:uncharacterized damage-inducible protein DinB